MNEVLKVSEAPADSGKWVGRVVVAVILGEGIWGLLVSITNNLALPALTRIMGADPQSPLYLGKSDFNFAALFTAATVLDDSPLEMEVAGHPWSPQNFDQEFRGPVSARQAMFRSMRRGMKRACRRA